MSKRKIGFIGGRRGWSRNELRVGRLLRDGEGHGDTGAAGGTGESGGGGQNNQGGTPAPGNNVNPSDSGQNQNNTGSTVDPATFWNNEPAQEPQGTPNDDETGTQLGQQMLAGIEAFNTEGVFTPEALQQMRDGDLTGLNTGIVEAQKNAMRQMLGNTAQMMQAFETSLLGRVEALITGRLDASQSSQRDEALLTENFPSYANPASKPVIQGVFTQSLKHADGDRAKALTMTREMLATIGQVGHSDLGFQQPAGNPDDNLAEGPSRLVRELLTQTPSG